ncbi:hypothetical protein Prudu_001322 [Prunus dulcis]|uniref:Uncharacterized protein n=1 Tax=Prunus dulcis TaxID=3755 RepID=A0A4Y1QNG2_PRUDU|nr:hypothetical protein Prudu_001322 [Prunus dulcis]
MPGDELQNKSRKIETSRCWDSPRQYFNLPKPQSFDDRLKESLRVLLQEETKKMEAKAREALRMEARTKQLVEAEREHFLDDNAKKWGTSARKEGKKKKEMKRRKKKRRKKMKKSMTTRLLKLVIIQIWRRIFFKNTLFVMWKRHSFLRISSCNLQFIRRCWCVNAIPSSCLKILHNLQAWKKLELCVSSIYEVLTRCFEKSKYVQHGFIDPATVSANSGTIADRSRCSIDFRKTDGEQIFMMPYNPGMPRETRKLHTPRSY